MSMHAAPPRRDATHRHTLHQPLGAAGIPQDTRGARTFSRAVRLRDWVSEIFSICSILALSMRSCAFITSCFATWYSLTFTPSIAFFACSRKPCTGGSDAGRPRGMEKDCQRQAVWPRTPHAACGGAGARMTRSHLAEDVDPG